VILLFIVIFVLFDCTVKGVCIYRGCVSVCLHFFAFQMLINYVAVDIDIDFICN